NQVSVGNSVTSLRLLAALDWQEFVERASLVEAILRQDPSGVYPRQDFASRDRYRRAVERLGRRRERGELDGAREAVPATQTHRDASPRDHVGFHLVGPGAAALRARLGYRPRAGEWLREGALAHPRLLYFALFGGLTALLLAGIVGLAGLDAATAWWRWLLALGAALLPASEIAARLTNTLVTLFLPPRVLPRLALKEGIPADCAAFVVIPSMLARPQSAATLLEQLEIHYLANPDPRLYFALLTDFADSGTESRPEDERYLQAALE